MLNVVQKDIPSLVLDQATKFHDLMHKDKDLKHNGIR